MIAISRLFLFCSIHFEKYLPALLFQDYCLTLDKEIQVIWGNRFSIVTILFVLIRYGTILSKIIWIITNNLIDWDCIGPISGHIYGVCVYHLFH